MKTRWILPFMALLGISAYGAVHQPAVQSAVDLSGLVAGDMAWMLAATALVLLMTPGLAFFYGGMVQNANVISTMFQSFIAMGVISILWVVFGFSLCFGESINGLIGNPLTYFFFDGVGAGPNPAFSGTIPFALFALFQLKFAIITPALITGAFAERVRFRSYLLFICLFSIFIYAPLAHWTWHPEGLLRTMGVLDFAGGTVVHMSAGFAALAGALVLGQRKVHKNGAAHAPAQLPYVLLGTGMLWFGWFGFNAGSALAANSTASLAFLTTDTASAAAMLAWIFFDAIQGRKPSAMGGCIGAVVGLVAITPAAGFVTVGQSIFIGFIAAIISNLVVSYRTATKIDDTLDVFPCHGVGGIVGMICTGIFATDVGLIYGKTETFIAHMAALLAVGAYTFLVSFVLYKITNTLCPLRVSEAEEEMGLDRSQHGETLASGVMSVNREEFIADKAA